MKSYKKKIFIDFDDTIFNTRDFSSDYRKIFDECGVCKDIFKDLYYDYPQKDKSGKLKKYDFQKHVARIGEECQMDTTQLKDRIEKLITNTKKYIFPDVPNFLRMFEKNNLFLISYGRTKFQEKKILNSGIKKFFNRIVIIDELKSDPISRIVGGKENIYFLDDRIEQVEAVKKKFDRSTTFLVKRKEGRYDDKPNKYCDFVIENLKEALKLIK